jgi:hypothetical protein
MDITPDWQTWRVGVSQPAAGVKPKIILCNIIEHPTAVWTAQQVQEGT